MAAFTTFSRAALERYLVMFDIGELHRVEPIAGGIENSNYYVTLKHGENTLEFVLTIAENLGFDEVGFFNDLLAQLDRAGLPVPLPERTLDGMPNTIFCGKPTWLFPRLPGSHPLDVNTAQCEAVGTALARLHEAAQSARYTRANPYVPELVIASFNEQCRKLGEADRRTLARIADEYSALARANDLPKGIIHGDLFRDNALFTGDNLTGIIDFYHACEDFLVQDVAITLNEWCTDESGNLAEARMRALLAGYESVRPLSAQERNLLPAFRRVAAIRFVLTRLISGGGSGHLKDPEEFLRIVRASSSE